MKKPITSHEVVSQCFQLVDKVIKGGPHEDLFHVDYVRTTSYGGRIQFLTKGGSGIATLYLLYTPSSNTEVVYLNVRPIESQNKGHQERLPVLKRAMYLHTLLQTFISEFDVYGCGPTNIRGIKTFNEKQKEREEHGEEAHQTA